jgi:hypothetical protein
VTMEDDRATGPGTTGPGEARAGDHVCSVAFCPVAMLLTATQQVRPEVIEHLLAAGREFLLAARAVLDARTEGFARTSNLEHIEIE